MKSKFAVAILSTLLYAQGLLGIAVLASVIIHGKADASPAGVSIDTSQR